ncbi:hypothetical protein Clacol_001016 [Clathrus columnatus]|uniref:Uncharacterized protein n=1 Tax=Clathrus columnatus TaxID=1419009 RepID=A0AAV5A4K3_9AGAM|nr:hypothetical protein Clacol_001016 [Clathrus columnatus]
MGGFVITDRERNPINVLMLGPINDTNLDLKHRLLDPVKAAVQISVESMFYKTLTTTRTADAVVEAAMGAVIDQAVMDAVAEAVVDEAVPQVLMAAYRDAGVPLPAPAVLETKLEEEVSQFFLGPGMARITNIAVEVLVEAIAEALVEVLETGREKFNLRDRALRSEGLFFRLRHSLAIKVGSMELRVGIRHSFMEKLRARLRGDGLRDTLETLVYCREEEIQDKSKQDWLAKTFALTQTIWFVIQCVARKAQRLPLTEIELMTCAYAALSAAIYVFWWNKPFRVDFPMLVHSNIPHKSRDINTSTSQPNSRRMDVITLAKFLHGSLYDEISFSRRLQVPTFYSGFFLETTKDIWNFLAGILTAAVFGGIHLFAWKSEFPSRMELWLWRLSALVIVGAPPIIFIPVSILIRNRGKPHVYFRISKTILPTLVLLYVNARFVILVLAMISLRKLSPGVLTDVEWLTFIPHIS